MKEGIIVVLGEDTPKDVVAEFKEYSEGVVMSFSWDNEDNECMPKMAEYLSDKYNTFKCSVMLSA